MATTTGINYADHTFSPWWGCAVVSAGCQHCYASELAQRFRGRGYHGPAWWTPVAESTWRQPEAWNRAAAKAGERRRVLVSMTDWLLEMGGWSLSSYQLQAERNRFFELILATPHLDWLLLTKRPEAWRRLVPHGWMCAFPPNVWAGVTIERADCLGRLAHLREMPARVRWVSYEPALGPIDWPEIRWLSWMVAGGESGKNCRPCERQWLAGARRACINDGVAYWWKQWGGYPSPRDGLADADVWCVRELPTPRTEATE